MKKTTKKTLVFAFIAILTISSTLISCQKNSIVGESNNNSANYNPMNYASVQTNTCDVLTETEIESIGVMHNELLDKILTEFDYNSLPASNMIDVARNAFIQTEYMSATNSFKETTFDAANTWRTQSNLTANVEQYMNSVKAELESDDNYSEISDFLADLKSDVNNDASLTDDEKQAIKIGISVALNSAKYWLPVEYGGNGKGYAHIVSISQHSGNGTPTLAGARTKAANIAGSDAIGGASSGMGFCGAAIFGGPVGVGAFVGSIVWGAVSSSLAAWALS